jgi:hypothetical protein
VWNLRSDLEPQSGIKDYDIFYFDPSDLSETAEAEVQAHTASVLGDLGVTVEVANQAPVSPQQCHAPYGLTGLYSGTLTPNPATPYPKLFASKVASYRARWNWLQVASV